MLCGLISSNKLLHISCWNKAVSQWVVPSHGSFCMTLTCQWCVLELGHVKSTKTSRGEWGEVGHISHFSFTLKSSNNLLRYKVFTLPKTMSRHLFNRKITIYHCGFLSFDPNHLGDWGEGWVTFVKEEREFSSHRKLKSVVPQPHTLSHSFWLRMY